MSKLYKTPGDYIVEISSLPASIASVETAIPAFIGYTQKAQRLEIGDLLLTPTRIDSMLEYEKYFGTKVNETINVTITDELLKTGAVTVLNARKIELKIPFLKNNMHYHLQSYFANGGGSCYIVSVGKPKQALIKRDLKKGLDEVYQYAEPTLLVFPDGIHLSRAADLYSLYNDALTQAHELGDRFVIMDLSVNDLQDKSAVDLFRESVTGGENHSSLRYGAAYYPLLQSSIAYHYADSSVRITHEVIAKEQGFTDNKSKGEFDLLYLNNPKLNGTSLYNEIKTEIANQTVTLSPSSAVAGVYTAIDNSRGVWKAPANVSLASVKAPGISLNDAEQAALNVDANSGKSINAIRQFAGKGTLLWGARTLAGNDNEWRYISVRRFFNMVEESVKKATSQFTFEPNEINTWQKVRSLIENYLNTLWRAGALAGAKPEHAFFVRVGLGQTMTPQDILEGRMNIEIGMAPAKPAEFIIIRFTQVMHIN
jgi:uncharacterized protein